MEDHQLLARYAARGDGQALAELVRRYEPLVGAAARRQVRDAHLAQDVTQGTLMTLMRRAGQITPKTPLGPWLLKVTHDLSVDTLRSESARRKYERLAAAQRSAEQKGAGWPWPKLDPVLDEAMHALREDDRVVLVLRYLQDWSIEQVARQLGTTPAATRQRLCRALRRLRKILAQRGLRRQDLLPIALMPPVRRWRPWPAIKWITAASVAAAVGVGAVIISRSLLHHPAANSVQASAPTTPPPIGQRPQSTIP